jgi:stage III sporulation protein AD
MSGYLQIAAGVLLAVIMVLALGKDGKQTAILLVIAVCGMVGILTMGYLEPVVAFIRRLGTVGKVNTQMIGILLKVVGIGFIGEISSLICADSGNTSLGKVLQMLSAAVILRLALPLLEQLLDLLERILGEV